MDRVSFEIDPKFSLIVSNSLSQSSLVSYLFSLFLPGHVYETDFDSCDADPTLGGKHDWMALVDRKESSTDGFIKFKRQLFILGSICLH
jgi:hypothetical protein